ncbi:MAG: PIN domain-containing protein [Gammaproteobacteria bacterium]
MLAQRGRIELDCSIDAWRTDLIEAGVIELAIDGRTARAAASLEDFHRDSADRFIVATALLRDATLVTADEKILQWVPALKRQNARA